MTRRANECDLGDYCLSLKWFYFNPETKELSAEISSIPANLIPRPLYTDACDLGIAIRSHVTNKVERFAWNEAVGRDTEGERQYWEFLRVNPNCPVKKATIFND